MRTYIHIFFAVVLCSALGGCKDQTTTPEPSQWLDYYSFVDEGGEDFFKAYPSYQPRQVVYHVQNFDASFQEKTELPNGYVFGPIGLYNSEEVLIDFGNRDMDTLVINWFGEEEKLRGYIEFASKIEFFYNGEKVDEWDFKANPSLYRELEDRNLISDFHPKATDPIVVKLPKKKSSMVTE